MSILLWQPHLPPPVQTRGPALPATPPVPLQWSENICVTCPALQQSCQLNWSSTSLVVPPVDVRTYKYSTTRRKYLTF